MAARVIHFGWDDCHRVQVLQSEGYKVRKARSLETLRVDLEEDEQVDAVILSEADRRTTANVVTMVRQYSSAPLILFRSSLGELDERDFDLVFFPLAPPSEWLGQTATLIAESQQIRKRSAELRERSEQLRLECEKVGDETKRQLERAEREIQRNASRRVRDCDKKDGEV